MQIVSSAKSPAKKFFLQFTFSLKFTFKAAINLYMILAHSAIVGVFLSPTIFFTNLKINVIAKIYEWRWHLCGKCEVS